MIVYHSLPEDSMVNGAGIPMDSPAPGSQESGPAAAGQTGHESQQEHDIAMEDLDASVKLWWKLWWKPCEYYLKSVQKDELLYQ